MTLSSASSLTIGDYFLSARKLLKNNGYLFLRKGLKVVLSHNIEVDEIEKIKISLEKHGPFYHPIKVIVFLKKEEPVFFVLNGAVSEMGLALIENEYQNLYQLKPKVFIPEVFGMGFVKTEKGKVGFFLAEWFDNFEEFHVVRTDNKNKTGILKKDGSFSLIPDSEAFTIYEKASEILTYYYGIDSLKQIFPWHHAAGDFIIKINNNDLEVKLITIRGYDSLMKLDGLPENSEQNSNFLLGLFFFFLNLSIRMRIDRNKGTEEYVFLDEIIVQATIRGFINGLKENLKKNQKSTRINPDFFDQFIEFVKEFDLKDLLNAFIMITGSYNKEAPETLIIEKNLELHAIAVFQSIKKF